MLYAPPVCGIRPACNNILSVVVVLPASICAMIPTLRTREMGTFRATCFSFSFMDESGRLKRMGRFANSLQCRKADVAIFHNWDSSNHVFRCPVEFPLTFWLYWLHVRASGFNFLACHGSQCGTESFCKRFVIIQFHVLPRP